MNGAERELGVVSGFKKKKKKNSPFSAGALRKPREKQDHKPVNQDTVNLGVLSSLEVSVDKKQLLLQLWGKNNGAKFISGH